MKLIRRYLLCWWSNLVATLLLWAPFFPLVTGQTPPMSHHTSNHAVIVSSSRYWFNYRHNTNAVLLYNFLIQHGFDHSNMVVMLSDEYALNPRNPVKNAVFNTGTDSIHQNQHAIKHNTRLPDNLLDHSNIEIDYRDQDVTVQNLIQVLTGRSNTGPVLHTDQKSNLLLYLTGHGGDQFFKFQDVEELLAHQLADVLEQLSIAQRYHEILLLFDTCQAFTMGDIILKRNIPNVTMIGSSLRGQSSYAHVVDTTIGLATVEKYTHYLVDYLKAPGVLHDSSVYQGMVEPFLSENHANKLGGAQVGTFTTSPRNISDMPLSDFFVAVQNVAIKRNVDDEVPLDEWEKVAPVVVASEPSSEPLMWNTQAGTDDLSVPTGKASVLKEPTSMKQQQQPKPALEPDDPQFLLLVGGLLGVAFIGSRFLY